MGSDSARRDNSALAVIIGILFALDCFRAVEVASQVIGDGEVRLLDPAEHLLIELFLETLDGLQNRVGVSVFGFEIGTDFRRVLAEKAVVMVHPAVAVNYMLDGFSPGAGRRGGRFRRIFFGDCWYCFLGVSVHKPLLPVRAAKRSGDG